MRRIVIIVLVLAIMAGVVVFLFRRTGVQKLRGAAQNMLVKINPSPAVPSPPAIPPPEPHLEAPQKTMPMTPPEPAAPATSQLPVNVLPYAVPPPPEEWAKLGASQRLADARGRLQPQLDTELSTRGFQLGDAAFIRIFKESGEFELWLQSDASKPYRLYCNYRIALFSGVLGPKTKEGDMQAPEGFYSVARSQLNPASSYHLAFNIGYPNEFDRFHQRTGSLIMVHGSNVSVGCFAMTDPVIEEIYLIVEAALNRSQDRVPVHVFPFRMTGERLAAARLSDAPWLGFWEHLKEGHNAFETDKLPPRMSVREGSYVIMP